MSIPVIVVCAIDPVARETAGSGLLLDLPGAVLLRHDLQIGEGDSGSLRRRITDLSGVRSDDTRHLGHACLSCAVRDDIIPSLQALVDDRSWSSIILLLPLAAEPGQVAWAIEGALHDKDLQGCHVASVLAMVDFGTLPEDLLGEDTLIERAIAVGAMDQRTVGEALSAQVEYADVVAGVGGGGSQETGLTLTRHLVDPVGGIHADWYDVDAEVLIGRRHEVAWAGMRLDPVNARTTGAEDSDGVWTLELHSLRPFHPERLLSEIEAMGSGRMRARGSFWLPSRPGVCCVWDGAGGQLFIGQHGAWGSPEVLRSRIVVTGDDASQKERIERAFHQAVLTDAEWANISQEWSHGARAHGPDGLEPWLGERGRTDMGDVA